MPRKDKGFPAAPVPSAGISQRQRLLLLGVAVGGHGLKHLFSAAFFVLLPEIKAGLGLSNLQVGALSTIRNAAGGVTNLFAGYVGDRYHRRRADILALSIAGIGAGFFVMGVAGSFSLIVVGSVIMIFTLTFWHPVAISAVSREYASRRGFAIALHGTGGSVGEALGPLIVGALLVVVSWRFLMQATLAPALAIAAAIWLALRLVPTGNPGVASAREYFASVRQILRNPRLLLVLFFAGGFGAGQSVVFTFLPIYLREDLGATTLTLGLYLFAAQAAGIATQPLMGYLSDRLNRRVVAVPALAVLGCSMLGLYLVPPGWPLVLTVIVMGAFLFSLMSIFLAAATDLVPSRVQGTAVSLAFGATAAMSALAPLVGGVFADAYGVKTAFLWAAGVVLTAALVSALTRWRPAAAGPRTP